MSYDLRIGVKVEGTEIIAVISEPERHSPTYNLGPMFRACTGWDFVQSEWYSVQCVYPLIQRGLAELIAYPEKYRKYEPDNGYGTVEWAVEALQSLRKCIDDITDGDSCSGWNTIPREHLWVAW